jgi:hypothetical protein
MDVIGWVGVGGPERQPGMQALAGHIGPPVDRRARRQASNHLTHPSSHQHTCVQARICWLQLRPPQPPTQPPHAQPARPPAQQAAPHHARTCVQAKIQGMARRVSMDPWERRLAGRDPMFMRPSSFTTGVAKGGGGRRNNRQAGRGWVGGWVGGREPAANTP